MTSTHPKKKKKKKTELIPVLKNISSNDTTKCI